MATTKKKSTTKSKWYQLDTAFMNCLENKNKYIHVENDGDYYMERYGNVLTLYLQWSHGKQDWKNNFDFASRPYKDMPITWRAHRGFTRVWKSIEPYVKGDILNPEIEQIVVVGYSHGAALAALAHEYIWYNRPDLREKCYTFAFEGPRVFCGLKIPDKLVERWEHFLLIRTNNDLVTHLPPAIFGYKHVGNMLQIILPKNITIKHKGIRCIDSHYEDNVAQALALFRDPGLGIIVKRKSINDSAETFFDFAM